MTDSIRQKFMDAMNRRADLIYQAESAFDGGDITNGIGYTEKARALNNEIEGYQNLMREEERFANREGTQQRLSAEQRDIAEDRVDTLLHGGQITFTQNEVMSALGIQNETMSVLGIQNATTLATGTLVEPARVDTTLRDQVAPVSSILDQVSVMDLTGCQSILLPLLTADPTANAGKVTTFAGTARTASDPTFDSVKISPYEVNVTSFVDRNLSRLTPIAYEAEVRRIAMRALRRKVSELIYNGDGQATADMFGIKTAKSVGGTALIKSVDMSTIEAGFLDSLVFAYGSDEELGGGARLYLNKADLQTIGKLRNPDDDRVYEIVPDVGNPNTGRIIDGGLIVPYTIGSALTKLTGTSASSSAATITMLYGDPKNYLLGLFGGYSIRIDESVKAVERMNAILGDVFVGGNLTAYDGFVAASLPQGG